MFPVETQATRFMPRLRAWAAPQVMPLSLKEPVGLKPWCLKVTRERPALGGAGRVEQGRVAFAQGDDVAQVFEKREEFAIAPDAALGEGGVVHAALAPGALEGDGVGGAEVVLSFEEAAAGGAVIKDVVDVEARTTGRVETG